MIRDVTGYQPLVPVVAAVSAGILLDRLWPLPMGAWFLVAVAALGAWLVLWWRRCEAAGATLLLVACGLTGAAWHHCCWSLFPRDDVGHYARRAAQPVCLEAIALKSGRVVPPAPPDPLQSLATGERTQVDLKVLGIRDGPRWQSASGNAGLLIEGRRADIRAGDRLRVFANLVAPSPAENPGQFDYARYLRADRRRALLRADHAESVQVVEPGCLGFVPRAIDSIRRRNKEYLDRYLSAKRAGLAGAVLVGAREELDPEQSAAFLETGTVHLLVVSGLNVGILAGALWWVLRRVPIPRVLSMVLVGSVTIVYMILTDAEPPIVRATVLVLGGMLALFAGRRGQPFNTLAAAALVVLAINPVDLFNVGAQLSFLCVVGLCWLVPGWIEAAEARPALQRLVEQSRSRPERLAVGCLRMLTMCVVLSLLTGPLKAARFHLVAPLAPLFNVVLWLPVLTGTLSGFGLLVLGWIWPLGYVLGRSCDWSMWALQTTVDLGRRVPGSHSWTAGPADWWLAGLYGALALVAVWPQLRPTRWRALGLLGVGSLIGYGVSGLWSQSPGLECTFLSVGHGCAAVLRLPDGRTLLYDAGHLGPPRVAARAVEGFLWSEGLSRLDAIVVSHADTDHYNAVPELLDRFSVGQVCVSPTMFRRKSRAVEALGEALKRSGIRPRVIRAGEVICDGKCVIRVLHPSGEGVVGSDNANSVVLAVEYLGQRILLPGDLDSPGLEELLSTRPVPCEVVLAPHHGSKRSHPGVLATWAGARWIVVTGGIRGGGGDELPDRDPEGRAVLYTARCGAVTVRIDAQGLTVKGYTSTHPDSVQRTAAAKADGTPAVGQASKGRLERSMRGATGKASNDQER